MILILFLLISSASFGQTVSKEEVAYICTSENEIVDGQLVLTDVDTLPLYPGGMQELYQTLAKELSILDPVEPTKVYVSFIVDTKGDLRDFCVKRRLGNSDRIYTLEADAIRGLKKLSKWTPGKHQGKFVPVRMTLPFIVTLKK